LKEQRSLSFGLNSSADVQATDYQSYVTSSHFMVRIDEVFHYINLPLPGCHNMCNALAAIAVSKALSIDVEDMASGLNSVKSVPHRLQIRQGIKNATILDDSYNANPASYEQAIATLKTFPGEHWIVLGDFGELGEQSEEIHADLGIKAKSVGIKRLLTIGNKSRSANISFGEGATHFSDLMSIQEYLESKLSKDITCLIKGSRFMQLDKLADELAIRREG
jgi:UDP-N-acetylmuramoyl-tripeptide--D-alanyl-D-alanine ligase